MRWRQAGGIAGLAAAVRCGDVKAENLIGEHLAGLASRGEQLDTFLEITGEAALARARKIDLKVARGEDPGPLAGVPIANKDLLFRGGGAMSAGSPLIRGERYRTTATVARRLEAAGAVELGRLAMAEFALSPVGDNVHFGPVRNPWDATRVSGGSSSGSGAAVADGQVLASLGSDTAGSIRLPAAMCGITGIKPTWGRVSGAGVFPLAPSLDCVGPLAPSAADCALVLSVIAGHDEADPKTWDAPPARYDPSAGRPGWRLAFARRTAEAVCACDVLESTEKAIGELRAMGAEIVDVEVPNLDELAQLTVIVLAVEAASIHRRRLDDPACAMGGLVRQRIELGRWIPGPAYRDALRLRRPLLRAFLDEALRDCDALLLPSSPAVAPLVDDVCERPAISRGIELGELAKRLAPVGALTRPFSFLGLPALSVPAPPGTDGMPVGLQLVGRPFAEGTLFAIGVSYQASTDWHRRTPPRRDR